jgi:hypothetical protein
MFLFITVCATSLMNFNLFSFLTYVPALQTGAVGCLLVLTGVIGYLRTRRLNIASRAAMVLGSFVAAYSKPETLVASWGMLLLLAIVDRRLYFEARPARAWIRHYSTLLIACVLPAVLAYALTLAVAGPRNMILGVTGYGLAAAACPWWPTGLGIFGAIAALGQAAAVAALFSLTRRKQFLSKYGQKYEIALAFAGVGALICIAYVVYQNTGAIFHGHGWKESLMNSLPSTLWTSAVLLPVMWISMVCWLWLLLRIGWKQRFREHNRASLELFFLLTPPVLMSTRGMFNTTLANISQVSAICYPFFLILCPYLLWRLAVAAGPGQDVSAPGRGSPGRALIALLLIYGCIRIAGGYGSLLSDRPYRTLHTLAGNIRLTQFEVNADIYRFVLANTGSNDSVLDIPYGGGINVASGRPSPVFTTQFEHLRMPAAYLEEDLTKMQQHPPKVVIAQDAPEFGVFYGLQGTGCSFPAFTWKPPQTQGELNRIPLVAFIQNNYRVAERVGNKLLLVPR